MGLCSRWQLGEKAQGCPSGPCCGVIIWQLSILGSEPLRTTTFSSNKCFIYLQNQLGLLDSSCLPFLPPSKALPDLGLISRNWMVAAVCLPHFFIRPCVSLLCNTSTPLPLHPGTLLPILQWENCCFAFVVLAFVIVGNMLYTSRQPSWKHQPYLGPHFLKNKNPCILNKARLKKTFGSWLRIFRESRKLDDLLVFKVVL